MKTALSIAAWCLPIVISVALTIVANDPIHYFLAQLFGGMVPRKKRGVGGLWKSSYSYTEDGHVRYEEQVIELRQFGNYVIGKNLTGEAHWYKMRGKVQQELYFTGLWTNKSDGDIYHGTFQIILLPVGTKMEGKWLGFDKDHHINHGPWTLDLLSRKVKRKARESALKGEAE